MKYFISCLLSNLLFLLCILEETFLSSEFSLLLPNTLTSSGLKRLFGIAFVFTVETGFIPISLADRFESTNSNIKLAKIMKNQPLNLFWHQNNKYFTAQLVMLNQLCHLTGISNGNMLIITLSYLNVSKCTVLEVNDEDFDSKTVNIVQLSLKYKNEVSVPVKCSILESTIGHYPNLCGIPEELILHIMTKLNAPDLYALMKCCKKLKYLATNNQLLWKKLVAKKFGVQTEDITCDPRFDWRNYYYSLQRLKCGRKTTTIIRE